MKTQRLTGRSWTWTKRGLRLATGICSNSSGITSSTRWTSAWLIWYFSFQFFVAQVMEDGRPFLDMAHVITSLNRLDAGIPDKVVHQLVFAQNRLHPAFHWKVFRSVWCQGTNSTYWWWAMPSSKTAWNRWTWNRFILTNRTNTTSKTITITI